MTFFESEYESKCSLFLFRPPAFPFAHPTAPEQNTYNWNVNNEANAVMLFDGLPANDNNSSPSNAVPASPVPSTSGFFVRQPRVKRKSESDDIMYGFYLFHYVPCLILMFNSFRS
jgi:hypothetical protein